MQLPPPLPPAFTKVDEMLQCLRTTIGTICTHLPGKRGWAHLFNDARPSLCDIPEKNTAGRIEHAPSNTYWPRGLACSQPARLPLPLPLAANPFSLFFTHLHPNLLLLEFPATRADPAHPLRACHCFPHSNTDPSRV